MTLEGVGRFINRPTKTRDKKYDKFYIYVPTNMGGDSGFPFEDGDEITLKVVDGKLIAEKLEN